MELLDCYDQRNLPDLDRSSFPLDAHDPPIEHVLGELEE
jgi:hypothetical protein